MSQILTRFQSKCVILLCPKGTMDESRAASIWLEGVSKGLHRGLPCFSRTTATKAVVLIVLRALSRLATDLCPSCVATSGRAKSFVSTARPLLLELAAMPSCEGGWTCRRGVRRGDCSVASEAKLLDEDA